MDVLKDYAVVLDFEESTMALYSHAPEEITKLGKAVPLSPFEQHFRFEATANSQADVRLQLDSSSGSTISLSPKEWEKTFLGKTSHTATGRFGVVGGKVAESRLTRIETLTFGTESLTNLGCTLLHNPTSSSSVGLPFMRQYRVGFDFPNKRLYLARRSRPVNEPENDMSGLHLLRVAGLVRVHSVDAGSPAHQAGVKPGDDIVSLDGKDCATMTMREIRLRLKSREGELVRIAVSRQGEAFPVEFQLRETI